MGGVGALLVAQSLGWLIPTPQAFVVNYIISHLKLDFSFFKNEKSPASFSFKNKH